MNKRQDDSSLSEKMNLSKAEACARYGVGLNSMMRIAEDCHAVLRIGRRVLLNRQRLDCYFMNLLPIEKENK